MAEGMILNAAFFFSLAAAAAGAAAYVFRRPQFARAAPPALALSWLALSAGLLLLWLRLGRPPLSNQYESLLTMLWLLFPLAFYFYRRSGKPEALPAAALAACVLFGAAALLDKTARPLMPALRSDWLILHVLSSMAAYAAFALAAAAAARALLKKQAELFEDLLARLAKAGFAFLTLGIITGSVWANTAWGAWWSWDPKETWSLLTWLGYAAALHLRRKGWRGHRFALLLLACFALVMFTYFGVNFLLRGMHSYA
ncbi:MAG: cytochrome c biogenesis protein CcsA [Elusimicrobia bacterium]|nr:cytochrome c biogenesis protein CcsA [Elusimicrobiota bacterium]